MWQSIIEKYKNTSPQVKASLWFVVCGFIQKGISFITTPIFSRILSTTDYGVFNVFITWQNIVIIFASLNLASGVYLRGLIKFEDDNEEFTASLQSLYLFNFIIVFGVYLLSNSFWNEIVDLPLDYMCLMFADILVQVAFHFWSARQRVRYQYRALVAVTLLNAIIKPTIEVIVVLNSSDKVSARVYTMVLVDVIIFGYFLLGMIFHKGKKFSTRYWKYALAYNLPLVPHYLSQLVLGQSDRIMINNITNASFAGIYSLASSAASILIIVNQSVLNSYNPWMYQKIRDKQYNNIGKVSYILLSIIACLNLFLIICAPEVIAIMAPQSYYQAIWVIPPVAMSTFFMFMYSLFANFEFYYEKTKYMMLASVVGAVLNIVLNSIFIRKYGFIAAGYTTLVCYICYCIAHYLLMKHILKIELSNEKIYDMRIIAWISTIFVIIGMGSMLLYNNAVIRYGIIVTVFIVTFTKRKTLLPIIRKIFLLKKEV